MVPAGDVGNLWAIESAHWWDSNADHTVRLEMPWSLTQPCRVPTSEQTNELMTCRYSDLIGHDGGMAVPTGARFPVPNTALATVVVDAPGDGPGFWAGAPSAALAPDGWIYLAYRLRLPIGAGRGYANVVARSEDCEHFDPFQ